MRRALVMLLMGMLLAAPTAAQEPSHTVDELALACRDNSLTSDFVDVCLFVLYTVIVPEAGRTPPDISGAGAEAKAEPVTDEPITRTGRRYGSSAPFELSGGAYAITYSFTQPRDALSRCFAASDLEGNGVYYNAEAGEAHVEQGDTESGVTYAYDVPAGSFFFDVISGCDGDWTFSISPA